MSRPTILIAGGGTAGHIMPALGVAEELLKDLPDAQIAYVVDKNNPNESLITESGVPVTLHRVYAGKLRRYYGQNFVTSLVDVKTHLLNIRDVFLTALGLVQSVGLIWKLKPAVVFCKGGFVCVPVALAAALARRPIITHDSDSTPGLANRIAGRFAVKNAVGVAGVRYSRGAEKVVYTGVPVSRQYVGAAGRPAADFKADIGLPRSAEVILVSGGSQGARALDTMMKTAAEMLLSNNPNLYIVHIFGRLNEKSHDELYSHLDADLKKRIIAKLFVKDLYRYAAAADIVITRAGATALSEMGVLGKACVVVPAPQLTGGHQLLNAAGLEDKSAIMVVQEGSGEVLARTTEYLLQHESERHRLGLALKELTPANAASKIVDLIVEAIK